MVFIQLAFAAPSHVVTPIDAEVTTVPVPDGAVIPVGTGQLQAIAACADGSYYGVLDDGSEPTDLIHVGSEGLSRLTLPTSGTVMDAVCLTDGTLAWVHSEAIASSAHLDRWKSPEPRVDRWTWDTGGQTSNAILTDVVALPKGGFAIAGLSTGTLGDLELSVDDGERSFVSAFDREGNQRFAHEVPRPPDAPAFFDSLSHLEADGEVLYGLLDQGGGAEKIRQLVRFTAKGMELVDETPLGRQRPVWGSFEPKAGLSKSQHVRIGSVWNPSNRVSALSVEWWKRGVAVETQTTPSVYGLSTPVHGTAFVDDEVLMWGAFKPSLFGVDEPDGTGAFLGRFRRGQPPSIHAWTGEGHQRITAGDRLPDGRLVLGFCSTNPVVVRGTALPGTRRRYEAAFLVGAPDALP